MKKMLKAAAIVILILAAAPGCKKEAVPPTSEQAQPEPRWLVITTYYYDFDKLEVARDEVDVSGWIPYEDAVELGGSTDVSYDGFCYPWRGEDSIHYEYSHASGKLMVNGELAGVDLRWISIGEIDELEGIVTVTCDGIDPQTLKLFPDLRIVYPIFNPESDYDIELLSEIPSDIWLYIYCINPTNAELRWISKLSNVRGLLVSNGMSLRRININRKLRHLRRMENLRLLSIRGIRLTDAGLRNIGCLKNLRELWLDVSVQTYTICDYLEAFGLHPYTICDYLEALGLHLPYCLYECTYETDWHLRIRNHYSQSVTEAGFKHIENLQHLETLFLRYGKDINEEMLATIASLPNLRHLRLYESYISNQGLAYLASHPNLEKLDCSKVNINDTGIMYVSRLPNLRYLYLDYVDITDAAVKYLLRLKNLDVLRIGLWDVDISEEGLMQLEKELPVLPSRR